MHFRASSFLSSIRYVKERRTAGEILAPYNEMRISGNCDFPNRLISEFIGSFHSADRSPRFKMSTIVARADNAGRCLRSDRERTLGTSCGVAFNRVINDVNASRAKVATKQENRWLPRETIFLSLHLFSLSFLRKGRESSSWCHFLLSLGEHVASGVIYQNPSVASLQRRCCNDDETIIYKSREESESY